jgi:hypothetical protein
VSPSGRERAADDLVRGKQVESHSRADNVDDRVNRADFMEVNLLDCAAMDASLRLGDDAKDAERQFLLAAGKGAGRFDEARNIAEVPMRLLFGMADAEILRAKASLDDCFERQLNAGEAERIDGRSNARLVDAGVDQGGQRHVAADSGGAVQVGDFHGVASFKSKLAQVALNKRWIV